MKTTQRMLASYDCCISIELFEDIKHIGFVLHCIHPCVPRMIINENNTVFVSSKGRMLAWPKEIEVNHLQRTICACWIRFGLIHHSCFPLPHVGTNIIAWHRDALKVIKSLTAVDHLLDRVEWHISQTTMPQDPLILCSIMTLDLCFSACMNME